MDRGTYANDLSTAHSDAVALGLRPAHAANNVLRYMDSMGWVFEGDNIKVKAGVGVTSPSIVADRIWHVRAGRDRAL